MDKIFFFNNASHRHLGPMKTKKAKANMRGFARGPCLSTQSPFERASIPN